MDISFVVIAYNMDRELPRTLRSLSRSYQINNRGIDYEVLVMDNGSRPGFGGQRVESFGSEYRYFYLKDPPPSPAFALNQGVQAARGKIVCLMIDGARIATPGLVRWAYRAFLAFEDPTVAVLGWHLGAQLQNRAILSGYCELQEDELLRGIDFPEDGYRLFEISVLAGSCQGGWFSPMAESNAIFLRKESYWKVGGYDERFDLPGGGLVNLDFYRRAVSRDACELVVLLGEGVFHQIHGGIATNTGETELNRKLTDWRKQYKEIRGEEFQRPRKKPVFLGALSAGALGSIEKSARSALTSHFERE